MLSVVIPTFNRHEVLIDSLIALTKLEAPADEILVIDQSLDHPQEVSDALRKMAADGAIRWLRLLVPSIPAAMNEGLRKAKGDIIVFLDDDIRPDSCLLQAHRSAHLAHPEALIAGRVLQPWHRGLPDLPNANHFAFNSESSRDVFEFMGGNFSVNRISAIQLGGFDENFVRVAYRFEADFALRWRRAGGRIRYEASALIHHLKAVGGGTRVFGDYLRTAIPAHSVGEYYYALINRPDGWLRTICSRPFRAVATRHHLRRPWWIPSTLVAEFGGIVWGIALAMRGRQLMAATATIDGVQV